MSVLWCKSQCHLCSGYTIYRKDDNVIDGFMAKMRSEDVALNKEGMTEGYLGVDIQHTDTQIKLMQSGLTRRIISALGLDAKWSTSCETPTECSPLPRNANGEKGSRTINYASVVGMKLYLTGHSRLDCAFATNQCTHYTIAPTLKHECALIQIGCYLKGTLDKGLILSPSDTLHIDCYPDVDFAGLWKYEDSQDPLTVFAVRLDTKSLLHSVPYCGQANFRARLHSLQWKLNMLL
jgi:hypothetical protein